jgi:hypothetical protein
LDDLVSHVDGAHQLRESSWRSSNGSSPGCHRIAHAVPKKPARRLRSDRAAAERTDRDITLNALTACRA